MNPIQDNALWMHKSMKVDVIFNDGPEPGWAPVAHLARLAARIFDGRLMPFTREKPNRMQRLFNLRGRMSSPSDIGLLAILRSPGELHWLRNTVEFRGAYAFVATWIIDSFWTEHLPALGGFSGIDFVGYMRPNESDVYEKLVGNRACLLGWGSDVLTSGSYSPHRSIDVLRVGRQPPEWDDDSATDDVCAELKLTFAGRPPMMRDPIENQAQVLRSYASSKYVVAHSNLIAPANYTHPKQEYMTARWVDAISCGATIAGVPPKSDGAMALFLWPSALLEFDRVDLRHNLAAVSATAALWSPDVAKTNFCNALERLDWRWRLKKIDDFFSIGSSCLRAELQQISSVLRE